MFPRPSPSMAIRSRSSAASGVPPTSGGSLECTDLTDWGAGDRRTAVSYVCNVESGPHRGPGAGIKGDVHLVAHPTGHRHPRSRAGGAAGAADVARGEAQGVPRSP